MLNFCISTYKQHLCAAFVLGRTYVQHLHTHHAKFIARKIDTRHHLHHAPFACSCDTMQRSYYAAFTPCSSHTMQHLYAGFIPRSTCTMQDSNHAAHTPHSTCTTQDSYHAALAPRSTYTPHCPAAITPRSICVQHFHAALVPWCQEGSRGDASLLPRAVGCWPWAAPGMGAAGCLGERREEPVLPAAPSPTSPGDRGLSVTVDTGWKRGRAQRRGGLMPL